MAGYDFGLSLAGSTTSGASLSSGFTNQGGGGSGYSYGLTTTELLIVVGLVIAGMLFTFKLFGK